MMITGRKIFALFKFMVFLISKEIPGVKIPFP
jgi:hypothetical protein